jgi:hypothetical protein
MREQSKKKEKRGGPGTGGASGGGITFAEFQVIMEGTSNLPTVTVPVGFD